MESIDGVQNEFILFINYELHNLHHTYLKNSTVFCTGNYYIYYRLIRTVCLDWCKYHLDDVMQNTKGITLHHILSVLIKFEYDLITMFLNT